MFFFIQTQKKQHNKFEQISWKKVDSNWAGTTALTILSSACPRHCGWTLWTAFIILLESVSYFIRSCINSSRGQLLGTKTPLQSSLKNLLRGEIVWQEVLINLSSVNCHAAEVIAKLFSFLRVTWIFLLSREGNLPLHRLGTAESEHA